jgi:hypothetical protein
MGLLLVISITAGPLSFIEDGTLISPGAGLIVFINDSQFNNLKSSGKRGLVMDSNKNKQNQNQGPEAVSVFNCTFRGSGVCLGCRVWWLE